MPWHIERRGEEHCVVKDADGSTAGCHPTRPEAVSQLRALYANVVADVSFSLDGHPIVPNVLVDWRAWTKERDVNVPTGPGHNLRDYWVHGPGALKIRWGTEGDGTRCIKHLRKYVKDPGGLCQEYHQLATGKVMGRHPGRLTEALEPDAFACECPPAVEVAMHTLRSDDGTCPPGHHLMPDGSCMPDAEMDYDAAALAFAAANQNSTRKPYGNVRYADPGYQEDGVKRYPIDTEAHVRAAWSYINMPKNAARYTAGDLAKVRGKIQAALAQLGVEDVTADGELALVETNEATEPTTAPWEGVLSVEGVESGDGRLFEPGSLTWDAPPLPLMWQKETSHGGSSDKSVRVGSVTEVWRDGKLIRGRGVIDMGNPDGVEVTRRMDGGFLKGNSVDVDSVKDANVEFVYAEPDHAADGTFVDLSDAFRRPELTKYHRGRIRGTTLVEYPAFTEASLYLQPGSAATETASCTECSEDEVPADLIAAAHTVTIPDVPPASWFEKPADVAPRGALTVTDEGRVYGYLAPLGVRHRSFQDRDVYVPFRKIDYSRFMSGETIIAGGGRVVTGPITMNCGHLPAGPGYSFTAQDATDHYDNTCSIVASVCVGEDETGVWVAGALLPGVGADQVVRMLASKLSGDWRSHLDRPGWRELTAALLVPTPGFALARTAPSVQVSDGAITASVVPVEFTLTTPRERALALTQRLGRDPVSRVAAARRRKTQVYVTALAGRVTAFHGTHDQSTHGHRGHGSGSGGDVLAGVDLSITVPRATDGTRVWKASEVDFDDIVRDGLRPGEEYLTYWGPGEKPTRDAFDPREHYVGGDIPDGLAVRVSALLQRRQAFHGTHNQGSHGNWAHGPGTPDFVKPGMPGDGGSGGKSSGKTPDDAHIERAKVMYGTRRKGESDADWAKRVKAKVADIRKYAQATEGGKKSEPTQSPVEKAQAAARAEYEKMETAEEVLDRLQHKNVLGRKNIDWTETDDVDEQVVGVLNDYIDEEATEDSTKSLLQDLAYIDMSEIDLDYLTNLYEDRLNGIGVDENAPVDVGNKTPLKASDPRVSYARMRDADAVIDRLRQKGVLGRDDVDWTATDDVDEQVVGVLNDYIDEEATEDSTKSLLQDLAYIDMSEIDLDYLTSLYEKARG